MEALQKPGFFPEIFREFLGGQVCVAASLSKDIRARKQTCLTAKLLQKDSFCRASIIARIGYNFVNYGTP
jgi:hypothetical protein